MIKFGTDGIRGLPNKDFFVDDLVNLGKSISIFKVKKVVIGYDTRISKDFIYSSVVSGLLSKGIDVYNLGIISTPSLIFYTYKHKMVGLMITASHNIYLDNGIKIIKKGYKLSKKEEEKLINYVDDKKTFKYGKIINIYNNEYLNFLKPLIIKSNYKIALDFANGATYKYIDIFKDVSNNLIIIGDNPNGKNINKNGGSTHINTLRKVVLDNKCDIGFAFDGDGDRLIAVSKNGNVIDGDILIYIFAIYLKEHNLLKDNKVILSIMSNLAIKKALENKKIEVIETPVGDKYITRLIKKYHYSLGGESSGHIILNNLFITGDGILNALYLLKIIQETNLDIDKVYKELNLYKTKLVNLKNVEITNNLKLIEYINSINKNIDNKVIVRKSGTENKLRIYVSSKSKYKVNKIYKQIINLIKG